MLGLFSLLFAGGAAAKDAYDNAAMKNYSTEYDENGNRHYMDNRGNMYINGEKYIVKGYTDNDALELLDSNSYKQVEDMTGISKSTLIRAKKKRG